MFCCILGDCILEFFWEGEYLIVEMFFGELIKRDCLLEKLGLRLKLVLIGVKIGFYFLSFIMYIEVKVL